jgi:hypothetical protein
MANLARVGGTIPATTAIATTPFAIDNSIHDFLKRIRTHQLYKSFLSQQLHRSLTFDDYVREEKPPEKTETSFLEDLFRQRRRLRPERKSRSVRFFFAVQYSLMPTHRLAPFLTQINVILSYMWREELIYRSVSEMLQLSESPMKL